MHKIGPALAPLEGDLSIEAPKESIVQVDGAILFH